MNNIECPVFILVNILMSKMARRTRGPCSKTSLFNFILVNLSFSPRPRPTPYQVRGSLKTPFETCDRPLRTDCCSVERTSRGAFNLPKPHPRTHRSLHACFAARAGGRTCCHVATRGLSAERLFSAASRAHHDLKASMGDMSLEHQLLALANTD